MTLDTSPSATGDTVDAVADALASTWLFSSDSHVVEPPDTWAGRLPRHLADRGPEFVRDDVGDFFHLDNRRICGIPGITLGMRFERRPDQMPLNAHFDAVPVAAYTPRRYLDENAEDGIWGSVLYPTLGLAVFSLPDSELLSAVMRGYNDWLADFCSEDPARLKGIAMINVDDVDEGVAELERTRENGLAGAMITSAPPAWQPYYSDAYDRLWAAAQDLDVPLSMHTATERSDPRLGWDGYDLLIRASEPTWLVNRDVTMRTALGNLMFSGVFERYPRLKIGSIENELGWIPFFLDQMDFQYTQRVNRFGDRFRIKDRDAIPSQYWKSNCFASFQEDRNGMRMRDVIGVDNLVWGSDYPHTESTYPRSRAILSHVFADVPAEEVLKITSTNSMRLYGFEAPAVAGRR